MVQFGSSPSNEAQRTLSVREHRSAGFGPKCAVLRKSYLIVNVLASEAFYAALIRQ